MTTVFILHVISLEKTKYNSLKYLQLIFLYINPNLCKLPGIGLIKEERECSSEILLEKAVYDNLGNNSC